eukprot:1878778-Pleurochrysis_carterae.AAC.2
MKTGGEEKVQRKHCESESKSPAEKARESEGETGCVCGDDGSKEKASGRRRTKRRGAERRNRLSQARADAV